MTTYIGQRYTRADKPKKVHHTTVCAERYLRGAALREVPVFQEGEHLYTINSYNHRDRVFECGECLEIPDMEWQADAACAGAYPVLDFITPGYGATPDYRKMKDLCDKCPVWKECLDYGLATDAPRGIWGGVTFDPNANKMAGRVEAEYIRRGERFPGE